ncbi:class I SAM-dependent methyltransferase [Rhodococcus sp. SORGH_AS_0301]|uniref:class I SAM-dependent methyltransferase n=1 Tax=Rhodococcus sp. SORGH_AS_0301 TaxID=3041780 RepID=UPI0027D7C245|nr:class I SAM-dependent methyltransferase [Rhodococcus sp. SORGH_AS_0301]
MTPASPYDAIAPDYAAAFADELGSRPFDRGFLSSFARSVRSSRGTTVLDAGCGPGQAARELASAGLDVLGLDASKGMITAASGPASWVVGDMTALPLADGSVHGVCAWYSIVHTPTADLPALFSEFRRVTVPDGWLLLAFQTAAPTRELRTAFGRDVHLDYLRHDVDEVQSLLIDSGYVLHRDAVRSAHDTETAAQAFVVARARDHLVEPPPRGC